MEGDGPTNEEIMDRQVEEGMITREMADRILREIREHEEWEDLNSDLESLFPAR
jgi:hypothetical protein